MNKIITNNILPFTFFKNLENFMDDYVWGLGTKFKIFDIDNYSFESYWNQYIPYLKTILFNYFFVEFAFIILVCSLLLFKKAILKNYKLNLLLIVIQFILFFGIFLNICTKIIFSNRDIILAMNNNINFNLIEKYLYFFYFSGFEIDFYILTLVFILLYVSAIRYSLYFNFDKKINIEYTCIILMNLIFYLLIIKVNSLFSLWCLLECISITSYLLTSFGKSNSVFFSYLYFIFNSIAGLFIIWGISLINFDNNFELLLNVPLYSDFNYSTLLGFILIFIGFFIKMGLVPFHFWSLDVYNSLVSETLFFFIIINKLVLIYAFLKTFCCLLNLNFKILIFLQPFLFFICIVSIFIGSIGAFNENNFNRFLVLSSLPQISYVLIGFFTFNKDIVICALAYFLFYIFTLFVIFLVVLTFEKAFYMTDFTGIFYISKTKALLFFFSLISLAGVPPFIGFFGKFWLLQLMVIQKYFFLSFIILFFNVISLIYYLKLGVSFFSKKPNKKLVIEKYYLALNVTNFEYKVLLKIKYYALIWVSIFLILIFFNFNYFNLISYLDNFNYFVPSNYRIYIMEKYFTLKN